MWGLPLNDDLKITDQEFLIQQMVSPPDCHNTRRYWFNNDLERDGD